MGVVWVGTVCICMVVQVYCVSYSTESVVSTLIKRGAPFRVTPTD